LNCCPRPRATVQHTIPDTEGQLFDCFKITYEITVLLPDQLKKKRKTSIAFANMVIIKLYQFYNYYDVRVCAGNSRKYIPVNSSRQNLYDVGARLGNSRNY